MCSPRIPEDNSAQLAREEEQTRQARIRQGASTINQRFDSAFDPSYFQGAQQSVMDAYQPQIDRQFGQANRQVRSGLASRGILESTAGGRQLGDLLRSYGDARTDLANRSVDFANQQRSEVERQRQNLLAQNQVAADPSQASTLATAAASAVQPTAPALSFGDIFAGAINTAGNAIQYRSLNPNASTRRRAPSASTVRMVG